MKKSRQVRPVAQSDRDFVLSSAARLFREQGYDRTTVKEIAEACNMLPGSLHYRYQAKEDILVDLMRLGLEQASIAVTQAVAGATEPAEQLRRGINAHPMTTMAPTSSSSGAAEGYVHEGVRCTPT